VCMTCPHVGDTEATEHCNEMVSTVAMVCRRDVSKLDLQEAMPGAATQGNLIALSFSKMLAEDSKERAVSQMAMIFSNFRKRALDYLRQDLIRQEWT